MIHKRFVAVVQEDRAILKMFIGAGWNGVCVTSLEEIQGLVLDGLDLVIFSGGTDVNPDIYGHDRHPLTGFSDVERDREEGHIFQYCSSMLIPMAGICRGSQFLCAMNGGYLKQHVENHGIFGTHKMRTQDGKELDVTSTHHQMMQPQGLFNILGWAEELSETHEEEVDGKDMALAQPGKEPECVHWPETMSIGFQFHPEYMALEAPAVKWFFDELFNVV